MKKLNGINLNGLQVSDLFFNSQLTNYNSVNRDENNLVFLEREALLKDANEFSEMIGNQITPNDLVEDFLARV